MPALTAHEIAISFVVNGGHYSTSILIVWVQIKRIPRELSNPLCLRIKWEDLTRIRTHNILTDLEIKVVPSVNHSFQPKVPNRYHVAPDNPGRPNVCGV